MYGFMAVLLVCVATLTGGDPIRATLVAGIFFTVATVWSWGKYHRRIKKEDEAKAAARQSGAGGRADGSGNGNGRR